MAGNRTLTIIKPDAFNSGKTGGIIALLEKAGFKIIAARVMQLSQAEAAEFYAVHKERPFFAPLTKFMTSGKCMPMILERADAVAALRKTIGATDPAEAEEGTVRKLFAESKERNAIHASDSDENADRESKFFFPESD
jgi:nucleoside-diphosphate kinase